MSNVYISVENSHHFFFFEQEYFSLS